MEDGEIDEVIRRENIERSVPLEKTAIAFSVDEEALTAPHTTER